MLRPSPSLARWWGAVAIGFAGIAVAQPPAPEETLEAIMAFDADGDGRLTALELPARFQRIRNRADADRRGFATRDGLLAALRSRDEEGRSRDGGVGFRGPDPGMLVEMLLRFDADGDGRLSRDELAAAAAVLVGPGGPPSAAPVAPPPGERRAPQ
jgi:Ca2+-binding EF-hand superfamily protein